jgi:hypothetical protein
MTGRPTGPGSHFVPVGLFFRLISDINIQARLKTSKQMNAIILEKPDDS